MANDNASFADFFSPHAIFSSKVLDDVLLSMIDPSGENRQQELHGWRMGFIFLRMLWEKRSIRDQ